MPAEEIDALRREIVKALQGAQGGQMLGALLGSRLRPALGGRTLKEQGYGTLSDFAKRHLAEVVSQDVGASDVVFRLNDSASSPAGAINSSFGSANLLPAAPDDLFRIWKSPRFPYRLAVRKSNAAVRALRVGDVADDDEIVVVPPPAETHDAIAKRFIDEHLPEDLRGEFRSKIDERDPLWWRAWDALFNERLPAGRSQWLRFREDQLFAELDRALTEAGLAEDLRPLVRSAMQRSRAQQHKPRPSDTAPRAPVVAGSGADAALRNIVHAVIERMSEEELRRIWLPLGLVADALGRGAR
jgi:hypothetical protein